MKFESWGYYGPGGCVGSAGNSVPGAAGRLSRWVLEPLHRLGLILWRGLGVRDRGYLSGTSSAFFFNLQSRHSAKFFSQGLLNPLTRRRVCPAPLWFRGRGHTRLREREWGSPNSNIHFGTLGINVLCVSTVHCVPDPSPGSVCFLVDGFLSFSALTDFPSEITSF